MPRRSRGRRLARRSVDVLPPAASDSHLRWLMLDRFVHCTEVGGDEAVRDGTAAGGTLSETSDTCTGLTLAVSLRLASPPAVSRLYLHWSQGLRPEMKELLPPCVIAAHRHSILFLAYAPFVDQCHRPTHCPIDYFVYTASGRSPSLRRLPPCFEGGQVDPQMDPLFHPYHLLQQRLMCEDDIGLLCHGEEEFTVAEISCTGELCVLRHAPGEGKNAMRWVVSELQVPRRKDAPGLFSYSWKTDVVIPYGDSSLCWVDCYLGLLVVTVHGDVKKLPYYVPMPAALHPRRLYSEPGYTDTARRVCVTDSGTIKLVCISDLEGRSVFSCHHPDFKITTWNLTDEKWELDTTMNVNQLWAAFASDKRLPLLRPEYPTMSFVDHDVACFILNDEDISWLVEVNLKKKLLGTVTLYINEEEEKHAAAEEENASWADIVPVPPVTTFYGNLIIPSQFTMYLDKHHYLDKHAIKSLSFSKKLEEAKLKRAMEKGWIKESKQETQIS